MNLALANLLVTEAPLSAQWLRLWRFYYAIFSDAVLQQSAHDDVLDSWGLSEGDITDLLDAGLIVALQPGAAVGGGLRVFTVPEILKRRRRLIRHTTAHNRRGIPREAKTVLPTQTTLRARLWQGTDASCVDAMAFYDSIELEPAARSAYVFSWRGTQYAITTIPTGQRESCGLAQLLMQWCCGGLDADVWIDNIRLVRKHGTTLDQHKAHITTIYERAARLGIVFNEPLASAIRPKQQYEFLGVVYDHQAKTIALGAKTAMKLQQIEQSAFPQTYGEAIAVLGVALYAESVLRPKLDKSRLYYVLKNFRRRARQLPEADDDAGLWRSNVDSFIEWLAELTLNKPRYVDDTQAPPHVDIFTDATPAGWGAIIMTASSIRVLAGAWPQRLANAHINELEAAAVVMALANARLPRETRIRLAIDNTSALGAVNKGSSPSYRLNEAVAHIRSIVAAKRWTIMRAEYIKSADNPADWLSRIALESDTPRYAGDYGRNATPKS